MKNLVFIPTYWASGKEKAWGVFDHPTLVSARGTLGVTLESFEKIKLRYDVLIMPVPLNKNIEAKVKHIVEKFSSLKIHVLTGIEYAKIIAEVKRADVSREFKSKINLQDYPDVRNFGLIYAIMNDYDNIIMIDDDEVIEDGDYFKKAIEGIGLKVKGKRLLGKTGYYIQESGGYELAIQNSMIRSLWPKEAVINKAIKTAISPKSRFNSTSIALGGNMVINRELFYNVPFDPYISRGEDSDYLMNAKHSGYQFLMDKELVITHLPPKRLAPYWRKLRRDIYRFIYLREKINHLMIDIKSTIPYPYYFLGEDLLDRIIKTNKKYVRHCLENNKLKDAEEYAKNASEIIDDAKTYARANAGRYVLFQREWVKFVRNMKG